MQAVRSQVISMMTEGDSGSPPTYHHRDGDCERMSLGYYFVMPKRRTKQGRKTIDAGTLCVFGPFDNPDVARFMGTSACALGLLDQDAAIQPVAFRESSQARNMERKARRLPAPTHSVGSSASASHSHLPVTC
ncbi:hypothetical protein [Aromatoleum diolicum]|uniref:Uncharacterized protein n=1 Tax=Aromatoleum diolicum TaxID=75796 RepID=A0ABX1Q6J4_9RHOO|nr:hypothetical protein [Aromatoleum diolicum]NMG73999.1 hypothetical protein [Aromatoleum diolicum]